MLFRSDRREQVKSFVVTLSSSGRRTGVCVLALATIVVLALAYGFCARAGTSAIGALAHYVVIVSSAGLAAWALAYPVAVFGGRVRLLAFAKAVAPAQAVALSTQSRSEEHTSELQSLMRISYAVFCLKKKHSHTSTQHDSYFHILFTQ